MKTTAYTGRTARVTWVENGTNNAACLGIDGVIKETADCPLDREAIAICEIEFAMDAGIDLDRFEPIVDICESE